MPLFSYLYIFTIYCSNIHAYNIDMCMYILLSINNMFNGFVDKKFDKNFKVLIFVASLT